MLLLCWILEGRRGIVLYNQKAKYIKRNTADQVAMLLQCLTNKLSLSNRITNMLSLFYLASCPNSERMMYIIAFRSGGELLDLSCHATQLAKERFKPVHSY